MGQEQSQDPQESQSDPEEPSQPNTMNKSPQSCEGSSPKSPDTERKPRRGLWRDGGWIGSRMGSPPHGSETVAKTVWYQGGNLEQGANEDWNRKEVNSQSVWYDSDTMDQKNHEQLEQGMREQKECDLRSPQASGLISAQLLEQGLSSRQLSAAPSQPHAAGTQPAQSHGPGAQRREVHGSQREEEVGPDWKEGGVEGDREEVSKRETTYSRKSSETADIEEGGGEKQGSEEKGAKGRKKRRKKRGKRGGADTKLSSSSSIESQSQIEIQTQREQVTNLNTQSETKDKTGRADVQSPSASEPTRREEADKDAMHLPSQTEGQSRDAHGPDCDVTNLDPSCIATEFSPTDHGRTDLTEVTASQILETKELSEDESVNVHGPDDFNQHSTVTALELCEMDITKADIEVITTVQPTGKEVLDPTELELKEIASPVQQKVDNVESAALSEDDYLTVAGKAVASVDRTGLMESNCPKELPVKHSDPIESTEDSFLVEFPERNTQHVQSSGSNKPVQPVDPMGNPVGLMESACPTEAGGLPFEGTANVSPLQIREGRAEATPREYLEHCLASEMLRDQQHKEEKRNELWVGEEEAGKERNWERMSEDRNDSGMVHGKELSSIDRGKEQNYNEDLVATAVAVVTVAIASAMASIELSQQLAVHQSDSQESASNNPALAPIDTLNQLADDLRNTVQSTQPSAQLMNKENCQLVAMTPAETEQSHIEPSDQFTSKEQVNIGILEESNSVVFQCNTETEKLPATQRSSNQQANLGLSADTPSLSQLDKEAIQKETTQNKLPTCSLPEEEDNLLQVNMKPLPEANEMITTEAQTEIQLREESLFSCPVIDTGQHPEASDTFRLDSEENPRLGEHEDNQDQSICQNKRDSRPLDSHFQPSQTQDRDDSHPVESITTEGEEGRQAHEQGSPHSSKCKAEESAESCEQSFTDMSDSFRAKEHERDPQLDCQGKTPCEGEIPTLPLTCGSTLPVTPRDSTPMADPSPEEATAPVNVETGKYQSSQSLADMKLVPAVPLDAGSGTFQSKGPESVAADNEEGVLEGPDKDSDTVDTVDGWKERERNTIKSEEEAGKAMITVEDTSQTGN